MKSLGHRELDTISEFTLQDLHLSCHHLEEHGHTGRQTSRLEIKQLTKHDPIPVQSVISSYKRRTRFPFLCTFIDVFVKCSLGDIGQVCYDDNLVMRIS